MSPQTHITTIDVGLRVFLKYKFIYFNYIYIYLKKYDSAIVYKDHTSTFITQQSFTLSTILAFSHIVTVGGRTRTQNIFVGMKWKPYF